MARVRVGVGDGYDVVVSEDALADVWLALAPRKRVGLVSQAGVFEHHGAAVIGSLDRAGVEVIRTAIGDGEDAKSMATVQQLCRLWAREGLLRGDAVVALGGGVVGDTAGFAAAVYHRGIAVLQCPTTLLAMVDAAIGGKTAVNLPEGKNLVGAFHQPVGVLADVSTLATLPDREYRAGLGEVAKYALMDDAIDDGGIARILAEQRAAVEGRDVAALTDLVTRSAAIKARVVTADPEERTGLRATLNYGHTLAHALETVGHHDLHHGEAVAVGLVFAGALAAAMERIPVAAAEDHRTLVAGLGLPTEAPGLPAGDLLAVMRRDKKASGGLTFVLQGPYGLESIDDPPARALAAAFAAVGIDS
ncbi:MAG: 3-dehydroquinate synthase [Actinobacteria bacterium]|nr:3-dehydroquinate synthase [Actinomycetota bacterium]